MRQAGDGGGELLGRRVRRRGPGVLAAHQSLADVQVEVVGAPDQFLEHGKPELLRQKYGLDAASIARRAIEGFRLVPVHGRLASR